MKELISLDGNGNKVRFMRGNDGDIHFSFDCPERRVFLESVRVGVGNSGGQEVPFYVKQALIGVYDAMERWEKEDEKQPVSEGLEEEIVGRWKMLNRAENEIPFDTFNGIASHFAEWGAEHLKK